MDTQVVPIDPGFPQPDRIARAAAVLRAGGLVAFPTETVYGLGANALDAAAAGRIFAAKGRPPNNPLIVHVAELAQAPQVVAAWPETAARLAERFWPGPLTLVLPRQAAVPDVVTGGGPTVAVRVPAHPVALALLRASALPLAAPSANRSTELSPTRAEHVLRGLGGRIELLLDAGPTAGGIESTVVDLTVTPPRLLRPGLVGVADLEAVVGPLARPPQPGADAPGSPDAPRSGRVGPLPSPGMMPRHYAPRTPLECVGEKAREHVEALCRAGLRVGWVTFAPAPKPTGPGLLVRAMPSDPVGYAARLYAVLHELDGAGLDRIVVTLPPDAEEWLAVRDRLRRAGSQ